MRRPAVLHVEVAIGKFRRDRGQDRLDRPTPPLVAVIIGVAGHRQQVDDLGFDLEQGSSQVRKDLRQIPNAALLERGVIGDDRTAQVAAQVPDQGLGAGPPRIVAVDGQEARMGQFAGFRFDVTRKLKRNLLVGPGADPARHGRTYGLEIEIGARPGPGARRLYRALAIMIDLARRGRLAHALMHVIGQCARRQVSKVEQPLFSPQGGERPTRARQKADGPLRPRRVVSRAIGREFTGERTAAVVARADLRLVAL